jgi:hypothetical protein
MNIEINARVRTQDGADVGRVHRVVVDLEQQAVVSIVVLKGGLLKRDVLVPLDFVDQAAGHEVTLRLSRDELSHLPDFAYNQFFTPPPNWALPIVYPGGVVYLPISERQRLGPSEEDLVAGSHVRATDVDLGVVDRIEAEPSGHLDAIWVRGSGGVELRVPVEWIDTIDDRGVSIAATRQEIVERLAHESEARRPE